MTLRIYAVVIKMLRLLRPVIAQIAKHDAGLADQTKRAGQSVALNTGEGAYSQGRNVRARFHTALGSAGEIRSCLDVALAFGYIEDVDPELLDKLDHIIATLYRLTH